MFYMKLSVPTTLACLCAAVHWYHVSVLQENEKHFSHLSNLEREMSFRSEQGFYFSFYKRLALSESYLSGVSQLLRDDLIEAPSVINSLHRFNLFPELVLSAAYRLVSWSESKLQQSWGQCWRVERGVSQSAVWSCVGVSDLVYLYIHGVWLCAALTAGGIFLLATQISDSALGGLLAFSAFLFNHGEASRVMWAPPLRENFAVPFLLLQLLLVCHCLSADRHSTLKQSCILALFTALSLLCWQISPYWLTIQLLTLHAFWVLGILATDCLLRYLYSIIAGVFVGFIFSCLSFSLLLSSLSLSAAACVLCVKLCPINALCRRFTVTGVVLSLLLASLLLPGESHDSHVWRLLLAKLSSYRDFDTALYLCERVFSFAGWEWPLSLSATLLLPTATLGGAAVMLLYYRCRFRRRCELFALVETGVAVVMAVMFMRLKVLATPLLAVCCANLTNRELWGKWVGSGVHAALISLLLAGMAVNGVANIRQQHSVIGEYSDPSLEEALLWIEQNTDETARFAAPMAVSASVLLSTGRAIVNHPHYESLQSRIRTRLVYSVFGEESVDRVYSALRSLQTDYLVLPRPMCLGRYSAGCSLTEIWRLSQPGIRWTGRPPVCERLLRQKRLGSFTRVFSNDVYVIFRLSLHL